MKLKCFFRLFLASRTNCVVKKLGPLYQRDSFNGKYMGSLFFDFFSLERVFKEMNFLLINSASFYAKPSSTLRLIMN